MRDEETVRKLTKTMTSLFSALRQAGASDQVAGEVFEKPFAEVFETLARNNIVFKYVGEEKP